MKSRSRHQEAVDLSFVGSRELKGWSYFSLILRNKKNQWISFLKSVFSYFRGTARDYGIKGVYPWQRIDVLLGTITLNLFSLAIPVVVLQLYDRIIPHQSFSTFGLIALGVLVITIFETIVRVARHHIVAWLGVYHEYALTQNYFNSLIHGTLESVTRKGTGQHVENIENASAIREFEAGQGFLALLDLPFVILFLVLMGVFAGAVVIAPIVTLLFFIYSAQKSGKEIRRILEKRLDVDDRRYNYLIEILKNHQTLKGLGMEHLILRRYESIHSHSSISEYELSLKSNEARDLGSMYSYIMFVSIVFIGAIQIIQGDMTTGVMGACTFLSNRIMQPVQSAMGMWTRLQHYHIAKQRHKEMISLEQEKSLYEGINAQGIKGGIELKNFSFSYEADKELFKNVSLSIPAGSVVTVMGANGSGKTTLTLLMMGLFEASQGEILIDKVPLKSFNLTSLRQKMAYISAQGTLFQGSIMDNLTMFRSDDTDLVKQALTVSKNLGITPWINRLPYGFDTKTGDSLFSSMSAGLQQRICLARALISQPKILILDEANTALDREGDDAIKEVIEKLRGRTTVIFVTHRPSISKIADFIYKIDRNTLVPLTFSEMMSANSSSLGDKA